jgi:hypothetical protein
MVRQLLETLRHVEQLTVEIVLPEDVTNKC